MARALGVLVRVALPLAAMLVGAELVLVLGWTIDPSSMCDYPDTCIPRVYPQAYHAARTLTWLATGTGALACAVALVTRSGAAPLLRLLAATLVGGVGYLVSPFRPSAAVTWTHAGPPIDLHGPEVWPCIIVFGLALASYAWEAVVRLRPTLARHVEERRLRSLQRDPSW